MRMVKEINSTFLSTFRWKFRHNILGRQWWLFSSIYTFNKTVKPLLVNYNTQMVIEGFPRSANTFAVIAFQQAQPKHVCIAHHTHVTAQIIRAVKLNKPILVTIRNPLDAIISLVIRNPLIPASVYLKTFINYYTVVKQLTHSIVVADFDEIINNYGEVIKKVNKRFNCNFMPFNHNQNEIRKVFSKIDELNLRLSSSNPNKISRPNIQKKAYKSKLKPYVEKEPLLEIANEIYKFLKKRGVY
ncbi:MAG: hypothetical protein ACTSRG_25295 [Candidatus Helarchaeota archaeon]